jgi:hypothetical protein
MTGNTENTREALVLNDREGNWYAIPREVVETYRATGEQQAEIQKLFGDDVQGAAMALGQGAVSQSAMGQEAMNQGAMGQETLSQETLSSDAMQKVFSGVYVVLPMGYHW